jgi:hypothetical protein
MVRGYSVNSKCGHHLSRHVSFWSKPDQTRGVSYYMEGVHERVVRSTSQLASTSLVVCYLYG